MGIEKQPREARFARISPGVMMAISVLAASCGAIFVRYAQQEAPSLVIAAWRLGIGTLIMAPFALINHRNALRTMTYQQWRFVVLSGIFLAGHFACWITSLKYTTVASSVVLVSMSPLLVALISTFLLKEPLSKSAWAGLGIAVAGSVLVAFGDQLAPGSNNTSVNLSTSQNDSRMWGNILALGGAVFMAGYLTIGRKLRASLPLPPYAFTVFGSAALVLLAAALLSHEKMTGYLPVTYLWFLLLGLIPQTLGHAGFNWALKYLPASIVSIALLGEPIGSSIFAMILLGELPAPYEIAGGVLILTGIYLAASQGRNKSSVAA